MSTISDLLKVIMSARYGKDVRQSIHDAIEQCYSDATGNPASIASHVGNFSNPHNVTASQVGLGDAPAHLTNKNNPHGVTKAQVGLGNCDNTSDANKPVSTAQQTAINEVKSNLNLVTTNANSKCYQGAVSLCKAKTGTITLSDSIFNYKHIKVENSNLGMCDTAIYNGMTYIRTSTISSISGLVVLMCVQWTISNNGKTLTPNYIYQINLNSTGFSYWNANATTITWTITGLTEMTK